MDLWDDDRGQSVQVGAILLFAILVILLATYQSQIVPQENESAEFEHSMEVREDMLQVRNAVVGAAQGAATAPVTVDLGMLYPRHTFGVNPAPVSATLRTTESRPITVKLQGDGQNLPAECPDSTRFLVYNAGYNYLEPEPTIIYENTVLYADYGENQEVLISGESLLRMGSDGLVLDLVALQSPYSANGIGAAAFEPQADSPRVIKDKNVDSIELPTRLSESKWKSLLGGMSLGNVTVTSDGRLRIEFKDRIDIRCNAVTTTQASSHQQYIESALVERAGNSGNYDITVQYLQNPPSGATVTATAYNSTGPISPSAKETANDGEQTLSLKLDQSASVEYIVIRLLDDGTTLDSMTKDESEFK